MVSYETFVTTLLSGAEQTGLNVQFSQEQLDPHTLVRNFSMTCLPSPVAPGPQTATDQPMAVVTFAWDAALTAISLEGGDGLCDLFHAPDEPCLHMEVGCAYDATLDITINYEIPLSAAQRRDINNLPLLANSINLITAESTSNGEALELDILINISPTLTTTISRITARQIWFVEDQLHHEHELIGVLRNLTQDVKNTLNALAGYEPDPELADAPKPTEDEPLYDLLTYLRPPTA